MINFTSKDRYDFADLQRLVEVLRAPGGCPWDGAQTHLSIRRNFLEEAYEACEGFDLDDASRMREELGDVLLQVLFHTDIERAAGRFDLNDVCDAECKKLIFRHPALFGGEAKSWDEVKQQEKGQTTVTETLDGVARSLPATWRSEKIQKKAAKCGFRWESAEECLDKLDEESAELRQAISNGEDPEEELGDLPGRDSNGHVRERRAGDSGKPARADADRAAGNAGGYRASNGVFGRRAVHNRAGFGR